MFKFINVLCMFFLLSSSLLADQPEARVTWSIVKDLSVLEGEINKSIEQNKQTVLFFFVSWDVNSNSVDKSIWLSRSGLQHYSFIKIDLSDWGVAEKRILKQFKLSDKVFTPVLTIINKNGKEIENSRVVGPKIVTQKVFETWLKDGVVNVEETKRVYVSTVNIEKHKNRSSEKMDTIFKYDVANKNNVVVVEFDIDDKHYLYKDKFKIKMNGHVVNPSLLHIDGVPIVYTDNTWGEQLVYKEKVKLEVELNKNINIVCNSNNELDIFYQGSGIPQLFYPPQKRRIVVRIDCE